MPGIVGELLDEVFVSLTQFVFRQVGNCKFECTEMLDQVAQHCVRETVLICPLRVPKDAVELVWVGGLDRAHCTLERSAHILRRLPYVTPVGLRRDLETVILWVGGEILVAVRFLERSLRLLIEDIAEAFVEQKRKDELLVVAGVDGSAQKRSRAP